MSPIDKVPARSFFAELLLPLKHANMRKNVRYLNCAPKDSYWEEVASRTGGLERLSAASCTGSALLESLGRYWLTRNDANLPKLLLYLIALRQEIVESRPVEEQKEPRLTEFVYPLF